MANQRWKSEDWNNIYSALQGTIPPIGSNFYLGQNTHISLSITLCFKSCSVVYPFELGSTIIEVIEQQFLQWDVILRNLSLTWNRVKHMANNHRHELQFAVSDLVLVKLQLQPYRQSFLAQHHIATSIIITMDIFLIVVKLGSIAYKLTLATSKTHLVFHVSILRPFRRDLQLY